MNLGIRTAIGPTIQTGGILKRKDGTVISDKSEKLSCWVEHYSELYSGQSGVCAETLGNLPNSHLWMILTNHPILMK